MGSEVINKNKNCVFNGPYAGRDLYINMLPDIEREFVITHNADIKPVSYFTGRETELRDLRQRIEERRKSVLVSGMGGVGKTHICRKLFDEYLTKHAKNERGSFEHIGYIEYSGDMGSSLQSCLKFKQQDSPEHNQEAAWKELEYLASAGKLLLFVDNVDKSIETDPGLQRLKRIPGAIVLTSRQNTFDETFESYQIGFLDINQCKKIYERIRFEDSGEKVKLEEISDLEYVIEKLAGKHTITVELLAHLARTKLWTVQRLKEELGKNGFCLEFHKNREFINIQKSYEILYDLAELTESEKNILESFSLFPYIPLSAEVCNQWLLPDAGVNEEDDIIMGLYQKGWLQFDMDQNSYALHPVFAQFIYEKCKPRIDKHCGLINGCQRDIRIPESGYVLKCQNYIPFAENIVEKLDMGKNAEQTEFISILANLLQYITEYQKAEKLYEKLLETFINILGESHKDTVKAYNDLACVCERQKKYEKAEKLYRKVLDIQKRVEKGEDSQTVIIYNNLAQLYVHQKKYRDAEMLFTKALDIQKKTGNEYNLDSAVIYNNLANVYESQGKSESAEVEDLYKKSLQIYKNELGERNTWTAIIYNNLARLYTRKGNHIDALNYFFKAYHILASNWGTEHPNTKSCCENMKKVYFRLKTRVNFDQWLEEKMIE